MRRSMPASEYFTEVYKLFDTWEAPGAQLVATPVGFASAEAGASTHVWEHWRKELAVVGLPQVHHLPSYARLRQSSSAEGVAITERRVVETLKSVVSAYASFAKESFGMLGLLGAISASRLTNLNVWRVCNNKILTHMLMCMFIRMLTCSCACGFQPHWQTRMIRVFESVNKAHVSIPDVLYEVACRCHEFFEMIEPKVAFAPRDFAQGRALLEACMNACGTVSFGIDAMKEAHTVVQISAAARVACSQLHTGQRLLFALDVFTELMDTKKLCIKRVPSLVWLLRQLESNNETELAQHHIEEVLRNQRMRTHRLNFFDFTKTVPSTGSLQITERWFSTTH